MLAAHTMICGRLARAICCWFMSTPPTSCKKNCQNSRSRITSSKQKTQAYQTIQCKEGHYNQIFIGYLKQIINSTMQHSLISYCDMMKSKPILPQQFVVQCQLLKLQIAQQFGLQAPYIICTSNNTIYAETENPLTQTNKTSSV